MNELLKSRIQDSITIIEKEKYILLDLLEQGGLFSSDDMDVECESAETLISAVDELNQLLDTL